MKRVLVIGCPGSGKSTFSLKLEKLTKLPLYHLDLLYWQKDKTIVKRETFDKRLQEILESDSWIIDGNYMRTLPLRLSYADTVFFLDLDNKVCLDGIRQRSGKSRPDMPFVQREDDREFITFISEFNDVQRPKIIELLNDFKGEVVVFDTREKIDEYLDELALK